MRIVLVVDVRMTGMNGQPVPDLQCQRRLQRWLRDLVLDPRHTEVDGKGNEAKVTAAKIVCVGLL